ncbi:MAG: hypothetical protein DMG14_35280 [Acidobacteria bacterium]|nr:MAG: hypothetical protein DMG14_35280 [Acidobacteriota bacterium]
MLETIVKRTSVGNLSGVVGPRSLKNPVTVRVLCQLPQAARTSENRIKASNRAARRIQDQNQRIQGPNCTNRPEAGYLPIPAKLARAGVKDMVRISDARMSGTAFGTVILHVSPESAVGGPLALVRTGDKIRLSVKERRVDAVVSDEDLARRRQQLAPPKPAPSRGYPRLYAQSVLGAEFGCDFEPGAGAS